MSQIKICLLDSNVTCLGLSESWLTELIPDYMLYIPGYQLLRLDRKWVNLHGHTKKGGLCCYVNDNTRFSKSTLEYLNVSTQDDKLLHIMIEEPHIKKCILINVYRPPQGNR